MATPKRHTEQHTFEQIEAAQAPPEEKLDLSDLHDVKLSISADLGRCSMLVRDILELKRGTVVSLDKLAGEMTDIYVNGLPLGKGEVVVIGDSLHVRIGEIVGTGEKSDEDLRH